MNVLHHVRFEVVGLACLLAMVYASTVQGQCSPSGLDDGPLEVTKGSLGVDVHYTDDTWLNCGVAGDYFPATLAQDGLDAVDASYDRYDSFGFLEPYLNSLPEYNIYIYDSNDTGEALSGCITADAPRLRCDTEARLRKVLHHEMFHTIQRHYKCSVADCDSGSIGGTFGKWVSEGTARCLDDRLYTDLDGATFSGTFWEEVTSTMASPQISLVSQSYRACLFWAYCCERLGTTNVEPERGIDFVRRFWEEIAASGTNDSLTSLREEIVDSGGGSLDQMYHDYAICNYAHEFDVSTLPNSDRYFYLDEQPGNGGGPLYNNVDRWRSFAGFPQDDTDSINAYAAKYFELTFSANECQAVGFLGSADEPIAWALVGVTPDGRATVLSKGTGRDYGRTLINSPTDPINRVTAIVIGLSQPSNFEYQFDSGEPRLTIVRPTDDHPAHAGPSATPDRFLARVVVDGPESLKPPGVGDRSIKGLRQEDFTAMVGTEPAEILTASYVGSEYWLMIDAPEQLVDDTYDLQISLCDGVGITATSSKSVLYGDTRINHMIVIDRSGSMDDPEGVSKLDAAKIAATLYVDAVGENDRLGVIAFDGNTIDCDDDAHLLEPLDLADDGQRSAARDDIDNLSPTGWTSIGDGLWKAQDELDGFADPLDLHTIVLLSDGEENEARWWDSNVPCDGAAARIIPADTQVNAIALGPESNQTLMSEIGNLTEGDYTYVDVTDSAAAPAGAEAAAAASLLSNQLADAYMKSLQRARDLQRLFFTSGSAAGGTTETVMIPVSEKELGRGVVFANWFVPHAVRDARLYDQDGTLIGLGDASIYMTETHAVWHLKNHLAKQGELRLELDVDEDTDYIAGLLAEQRVGVQMAVEIVQVNTGGLNNEVDSGRYEKGVPVTILAVLSDKKGPVLLAEVDLSVQKPDGTLACGPLHLVDDGMHNDGEPDDGVYGAIFTDMTQAGTPNGVVNDDPAAPPVRGERGTYLVEVTARGESLSTGRFLRNGHAAFQVFDPRRDRDKDGLCDTWEVYYGTDPSVPDEEKDPDGDGLVNKDEAHHGTHPFDYDTDGGGESDRSELAHGRCPLEPFDDALPCPLDVEVLTSTGDENPEELMPNANALRFPVHSSYRFMRIFRKKVGTADPFSLLREVEIGPGFKMPYYDEGLPDGIAYAYRFQAVGATGAESCLSPIVSGVARINPVPPIGWAILNNGALLTDRLAVALLLDQTAPSPGGSWPKEYRASNAPLNGEPYLPMPGKSSSMPWTLAGPASDPGVRLVYVQYRDADGNESDVYVVTIDFDPYGDFDGDTIPNEKDDDDDGDGLDDDVELNQGTNPYDPDSDDDGLGDAREVEMGTNPRNPDTDGDGLLDGEDPMPLVPAGPGDFDGDGDVDKDDLRAFDDCANPCIIANVNCDDAGVNVVDLQYVKNNVFCTDEMDKDCIVSDVNRDGSVNVIDLQDVKNVVFCTDTVVSVTPGCEWTDFDIDGDVDHNDYNTIQGCLSGPNIPADPNCAD